MKKIIYLLVILAVLSACTSGNRKNGNNEEKMADTIAAETIDIAYMQCPLAYLIDGELYFHSFDEDQKVKFAEESEVIFNFTFDDEGKTLYYSVERDNSLWLKSADISEAELTPQWLTDWKIKKDDCISQTYFEASPLLFNNDELIIQHNFNWEYYDFKSMAIYSIANNKITKKEYDYKLISKAFGQLSSDKSEQYFKTIDQQLYYTRNNSKVCLTDNLNFDVLKQKENEDYWVETEFINFTFSQDETKILFGALLEFGDLGHGPYCIADANGSNQMIILQTDISGTKEPIWLTNNSLAFIDNVKNLFVINDDVTQQIAENVTHCGTR
ncbi:MAG: membrane lipoprotein lipid attachment site-containing protein [Bacteroidales bacterium]|nr:membrane lipoprotein lipid attachment site-containing protein [Bacteroidales bacterium]